MKICPNCKTELENDALFCGECGAKISEETPVEAAEIPAEAVEIPTEVVEVPVEPAEIPAEEAAESALPAKKSRKGLIIGGVAALLAIVVALGAYYLVFVKEIFRKNYVVYIKDGELVCSDTSGKNQYVIDDDLEESDDYYSKYAVYGKISANGKTLLYAKGKYFEASLYCAKLGNKRNKPEKIASDVFYYNTYISDDGSKVLYAEDDKLYEYDVKKDKKKRIDKDVANIIGVSDDLKTVFYNKEVDEEKYENYVKKANGKTEKIEGADGGKLRDVKIYNSGKAYLVYDNDEDGEKETLCYYDGKKLERVKRFDAHINLCVANDKNESVIVSVPGDYTDDYYHVTKDNAEKLDFDDYVEDVCFSGDGKFVGYIKNDKLYKAAVKNGKLKKEEKIDKNVERFAGFFDGDKVLYEKEGCVHVDGDKINSDEFRFAVYGKSSKILVLAVYDNDKEEYCYYAYKNGKDEKIGSDMNVRSIYHDGSVICEYYNDGELSLWKDGEETEIDDDVEEIVAVGIDEITLLE